MTASIRMLAFTMLFAVAGVMPHKGALACMGYDQESTLFFNNLPGDIEAAADVVAVVALDDASDWDNARDPAWNGLQASVKSVRKGPLKAGDSVRLEFSLTSCGPWHKAGEEGLVAARLVTQPDGGFTLAPYMHRRSDDTDGPRVMPKTK